MPYEEIEAQLTAAGSPFETVQEEVLGETMSVFKDRKHSLRELLSDSAVHQDKEYIVLGDRRITYREHLRLVASTARFFADRYGIQKGDRVAILAENHPEWIITFWAVVSLGGIVSALNGWWMKDEVAHGLQLTEPKLLVIDRKRLARIEGIDLPRYVAIIESDFQEIISYLPDAALPDTPIAEDDPAVILFTSGTTGRPKGAVNTHRAICGFAQVVLLNGFRTAMMAAESDAPNLERPDTCSLMTIPLFHLSGLYTGGIMMLSVGGKSVWRLGRFDAEDVLRLIEKERVTNWSGLGSMAPQVLFHPEIGNYDLSSIRNLGSGGAPTSPALQERMREIAPNGAWALGLGYGSSETVTAVTMISGEELKEHSRSVGRPQATHEIEIRSDDGVALPEGESGEIFVRSPYNMLEYWKNPEATKDTIHPGRWLATGDVGRMESGRLYINSRARDMILRAAENIYPIEIEQRLEEHPSVVEAAVVGVDHIELGQEIKAVVVPKSGEKIDTEALVEWVGEKLARFKVPAHWEIRDEPFPRNAAGKILKNVLTGESENLFVEE